MTEIQRGEAAAIAGVAPDTWSAYVARDQAPKPARHVGRTPLWDEDEVRQWASKRPGSGSRRTARAIARAEARRRANTSGQPPGTD